MATAPALDLGFAKGIDNRRLALIFAGTLAAIAVAVASVTAVVQASDSSADVRPVVNSAPSGMSDGRNGAPLALIAGRPMFPLPGSSSLTSWDGSPVVAQDIPVQSIAPDGFWMGVDEVQRVYVTIPPATVEKGSSVTVSELRVGELVHVSGTMRPLPDNVRALGLETSVRDQLLVQNQLLEANSVRHAD